MSIPYNLDPKNGQPDGVIVNEAVMTEIYMKVREYQRSGTTWGFYERPTKTLDKGVRKWWRKLVPRRGVSRDPQKVEALLFKPDGLMFGEEPNIEGIKVKTARGKPFDVDESWKAAGLLYELYQCAVPRITETMKCEDYKYTFYSDSDVEWLSGIFKQLHAFWSKDDSIVVFYTWGFVHEFEIYGMLQPNLNEKLGAYVGDMIVVVVVSIMRMPPVLLEHLRGRRDKIWHEKNYDSDPGG